MILTDAEQVFAPIALIRGGVFLLSAKDALRFVDECERRGIDVLGVEGFRVFGDKIQPFQEHSFDLELPTPNSQSFTKKFIEDRLEDDLWFEVITTDKE